MGLVPIRRGSRRAAIFVATGLPFLFHRAVAEDRVLRADLPG
jgi:hypothetical protein